MNRKMFTVLSGVIAAAGLSSAALAAGPKVTTQKPADNVYSMNVLHYNSLYGLLCVPVVTSQHHNVAVAQSACGRPWVHADLD